MVPPVLTAGRIYRVNDIILAGVNKGAGALLRPINHGS